METLAKLFGSKDKVKIIRLFLFNPDMIFESKDLSFKTKIPTVKIRKQISLLEKISLIKKKGITVAGQKRNGWILNKNFPYLAALQTLMLSIDPLSSSEIAKKFVSLGNVKLLVVSGVFIQEGESRVDILIVADRVKTSSLESLIRSLESEIGKELKYAFFNTDEFNYRFNIYDKLVRDILDYPHKKVINKLDI